MTPSTLLVGQCSPVAEGEGHCMLAAHCCLCAKCAVPLASPTSGDSSRHAASISLGDESAPTPPLCPSCWLRADSRTNPFKAFDAKYSDDDERRWLAVARAFAASSREVPGIARINMVRAHPCTVATAGGDLKVGGVVVVVDYQDPLCVAVGMAIEHAFGQPLVLVVDAHDESAVKDALADCSDEVCLRLLRRGGVTAVTTNGLYTVDCQFHPKVLLYELRYRAAVRPPSKEEAHRIQMTYELPLADVRNRHQSGCADKNWWWLAPEALAIIATSLAKEKFAVIDGFLPEAVWKQLFLEAVRLKEDGLLERGNVGGNRAMNEDASDLLNRNNELQRWTLWDDNIAYCADGDPRALAVGQLLSGPTDSLVMALKQGGHGQPAVVAERLRHVDFKEEVMVACYLRETRGRYQQHTDSGGGPGRWLTTILYLNEGWRPEDGGWNRMFYEGEHNTSVRADILPVANRFLIFWAQADCPHEVLSVRRDRYAMTRWYTHGPTLIREKVGSQHEIDALARGTEPGPEICRVIHCFQPIAPLGEAEALCRSGLDPQTAEKLARLYERGQGKAKPKKVPLPSGIVCWQCGAEAPDGRNGGGDFSSRWFCHACWGLWERGVCPPAGSGPDDVVELYQSHLRLATGCAALSASP